MSAHVLFFLCPLGISWSAGWHPGRNAVLHLHGQKHRHSVLPVPPHHFLHWVRLAVWQVSPVQSGHLAGHHHLPAPSAQSPARRLQTREWLINCVRLSWFKPAHTCATKWLSVMQNFIKTIYTLLILWAGQYVPQYFFSTWHPFWSKNQNDLLLFSTHHDAVRSSFYFSTSSNV